MIEIERKILGINISDLCQKIEAQGGTKEFEHVIRTKYFDYPDKRFKNQNEVLRVRLIGHSHVELTFKLEGSTENNNKRYTEKESKLEPNEWDNITDILTSIGFVQTMYFEKKRTQYKLGDVKLEIDEYPNLEPLVEIEASSDEEIEETIHKLELSDHEQSNENINELWARVNPNIKLDGQTL